MNKHRVFSLSAALLVFLAFALNTWMEDKATSASDYGNVSLEREKCLESAENAGLYLVEHLNDDGRYVYKYNPVTNKSINEYNIVRHAGTTYSLLELYEVSGDAKLLVAAEKALDYLVDSAEPCPNYPQARCIVEDGSITLGGNSLAILAMAKHAEITGSERYLPLAQNLAEFLLCTQSNEGEFTIHKIDVANKNIHTFASIYYPGEAIFALSRLYQIDKNEKWIESAHRGANWLIKVRDAGKSIKDLQHDHWLLYGLNELHKHRVDTLYVEHSKKIVGAIISIQHKGLTGEKENWDGGYYNPPRSTPAATRSEGLAAAYLLFERAGEKEYAEKALYSIRAGIKFQLRTQMTTEKIKSLGADPKSLGGFHASLTDYLIRIDYVQHNLSSLLGYLKITE